MPEYDPMRNTEPASKRDVGATYIVIGVVLLFSDLLWMMFMGWDIRAGNKFMQIAVALDTIVALAFLFVGWQKKSSARR